MSGIDVAEYPDRDAEIRVRPCPEKPEYIEIVERAINGDWEPEYIWIKPEDVPALIKALQYYAKID